MKSGLPGSFGAQLKALREAAGYTQEELATIAGLSVHSVSALEHGERRRPHVETVRALSAALDPTGPARDALVCERASSRQRGSRTCAESALAATASDGPPRLRGRAEREARARLGLDRWTAAYAKGRGRSIDALLKDIAAS
jgi:transcriptional regulator with XRE-family HTH domain